MGNQMNFCESNIRFKGRNIYFIPQFPHHLKHCHTPMRQLSLLLFLSTAAHYIYIIKVVTRTHNKINQWNTGRVFKETVESSLGGWEIYTIYVELK